MSTRVVHHAGPVEIIVPLFIGGLMIFMWQLVKRTGDLPPAQHLPEWMNNRRFLFPFRGIVGVVAGALLGLASYETDRWPLWAVVQIGLLGIAGGGLALLWSFMVGAKKGYEMDSNEHRALLDSFMWMFGSAELCLGALMVISALQ